MSAFLAISSSDAAVSSGETIVFCGDSITQTDGSGIGPGYRYQIFKNFVDNSVEYKVVGSKESSGSPIPNYGGKTFDKHNEGWSGWTSSDLNGDTHPGAGNTHPEGGSTANIGTWTQGYDAKNVFIMAGTNDLLHYPTNPPTAATVVARIQKCIDAYLKDVPDAKIYVGGIIQQTGEGANTWVASEYNRRANELNATLKSLATAKGYAFVDTSLGMRGENNVALEQGSFSGDNIHPNAQGELIMAGNIARSMGIGQRSAGLTRKASAGLGDHLAMSSVPTVGMNGKAWSVGKEANSFLVRSNGDSYYERSWTGANLTQGYTCELSLQMFAKPGVNQFSLQVGNGTTTGSLRVEQGRVAWGATILYVGLNTDTVSDYRVAYNPGNSAQGISAGYYVWRNGVLIGEALAGANGALNGVKAGSLSGGAVYAGVSGLAWDTTGAFASSYSGVGSDAKGTERLSGFNSLTSNTNWQVDWPAGDPSLVAAATSDAVRTAINALTGTPKNAKITGTMTGASASTLISANGDAYIDLAGTWVNTDQGLSKYFNLMNGGTYTGNLHFKVSEGGRITTGTDVAPGTVYQGAIIGSNQVPFGGNLYMEFDSSALTIEGRTLIQGVEGAVVGMWGGQNLTGSVTMVFKKGIFGFSGNTGNQGAIMAGAYNAEVAAGSVTKSTFVQIDGGTFYGAISAGGYKGHVATGALGDSTNMLIRGGTISGNIYGGSLSDGNVGTTTVANGTNILIDGSNISSSNPLAISGRVYGGARNNGVVYGDTDITLSNFDQAKLGSFAAGTSFNGGAQGAGTVKGTKTLTLDKVTGNLANALNDFNRIVLKSGTNVGLTHADSGKALKDVQFSGAGLLTLKAAGTYQFGLSHTGGEGSVDASSSSVVSNIILGKKNAASAVAMNELKLSTGSLSFDIGRESTAGSFDTLAVAKMTSTGQINIAINAWQLSLAPGNYDLLTGDLSGVSSFVLSISPLSSRQQWALKNESSKLILQVTGEASKNLTWNGGAAGTWQKGGSQPWNDGSGASTFEAGDVVTFTTLTGVTDSTVTLSGQLAAMSIAVSGDTNYTWGGSGGLIGQGTLEKSGNGRLSILTDNKSYSGQVTLKGGILEIGHSAALGTGALVFNGGTLKYGTGITADISSQLAAATTGNDNTLRVDTNGNNITWASARSDYAYVKTGTGTLSLKAQSAITYGNGITVNGGVLGFDGTSGNITLSGVLAGSGVIEKTGANNLYIISTANDLKGTLHVKNGLAVVGAAATSGSGADAKLGASSTIIVENGASFRTHLGGGTPTSLKDFAFAKMYVKSGGAVGNIDGHAKWTGDIAFNVDTIGADGTVTYNATGSSTLYQFYAKRIVLNGIVSGAGTVKWVSEYNDADKDHSFALINTGNTFSGTYNVDAANRSSLELATADTALGGVASKASVILKSTNATLLLSGGTAGSSFSLVNLDTAVGTSVLATSGAKTLVLNDTKNSLIAGDLGAAADTTNVINLEKRGDKTLTITGAVTGSVKATKGTLQLGNTATYTTTAGITIGGAASLNIGGVGIASTVTLSNLTLEEGSHLIMDVGPGAKGDKLLYTGTAPLTGNHTIDITLAGVTAPGVYVLIDSTSSFGTSFNIGTWVPTARGMQGNFIKEDKQLKLNITAAGAAGNLVWGGTASSNIWELNGANNWTGETDNKFYDADNVQFTDAAANKTVIIKGNVAPGSIVVNSTGDYVFNSDPTSAGGLAGSGSLIKSGIGRITLNSNNQNWSGAVTLNAGTLEFGENGLGKSAVTMENGTVLQWGTNNNQTISSLVANGVSVELNTGANQIGSQTITGTYTTLKKTGTGSITLAMSGAGKTLNVDNGMVTLAAGADITTSFIIGQGATLKLTSNTETNTAAGSMTLNGGTLDFGSVSNTYIGGRSISMNGKSVIKGAGGSQWRLEGDYLTTISVSAAGSGSLISVETLTFTRNPNAVFFNIEDGLEAFDLTISSAQLNTQQGGEKLKKTGKGTLLLTNNGASGSLGMVLEDGVIQIGNAKNGNTKGAWSGEVEIGVNGKLVIDKTDDLALCSGSTLLKGSGVIDIINTGKVNLTASAHTYTGSINLKNGATLNFNGGVMQKGTQVVINKGNLEQASAFAGSVSINQVDGSEIKLGDLNGSRLKSVVGSVAKDKTDQVTKISGVTGNISLSGDTSFGVSSDMVGVGNKPATGQAISLTGTGSLLIAGDLSLAFTDSAVQSLLEGQKGDKDVSIKLINGTLTITGGGIRFNSPYNILSNIFTYKGTSEGSALLSMKDPTKQGWIIVNQTEVTEINDQSMAVLPGALGVHNNGTINIEVTGDKVLVINNLEGSKSDNGAIITTGTNADLTLSLTNANGITSSLYHGSISGSAAIEKNGLAGTTYDLTIGGNVKTPQLTVNNGVLAIGGVLEATQETTVNNGSSLVLNGVGSKMDGGIVLNGTGALKLGAGAMASTLGITSGAQSVIELATGSNLTLTASDSLDSAISGSGGTFSLMGNGTTLTFGADGDIGQGTTLFLGAQTRADMTGSKHAGGISGKGTLSVDGILTLHDSTQIFEGTLEGSGTIDHSGTGKQTLNTAGNANMSLVQSGTGILEIGYKGNSVWKSVTVDQGTLQVANEVTMEDLTISGNVHIILGRDLENGVYTNPGTLTSTTTTLSGGSTITLGGLTAGSVNNVALAAGTVTHTGTGTTSFELGSIGNWTDMEYKISLMSGQQIDETDYDAIIRGALVNLGYTIEGIIYEDSILKAVVRSSGNNGFLRFANSSNTVAAADGLWQARLALTDELGTLSNIIAAIRDAGSGVDGSLTSEEATQALASYAGSSLTSLASSQRSGLLQQVKWIRNRTAQMGVNADLINEDMPYINAWIQGNAGYHKVSKDGDQAGYTMDSWGGTAGVDIDLNENWTVGAAFTADYAKIRTEAYDTARGNNDAYYGNLFARIQKNNWSHTVILTGGWNDVDLNRNVNIGATQYNAKGTTSGASYGAYYEGTYDIALNDRKTSIFQPLFNASIYQSGLDAYSESGMGDASMSVREMKATYGTVGLGARLSGIVGSNILGRGCLGEVRAQVVQDYGDKSDTVNISPIGAPNSIMRIRGSKVGTTGIQIGAGLAIPVAERSSIYVDVDADFRSKATVVTGNIGYRYNF